MTTNLSSGLIPSYYRDLYEICSQNDEPVRKEVYEQLLNESSLTADSLKVIWDLSGPSQGPINRTNFYKTLALIAWCQQGRTVSDKLFENFSGTEYPIPKLKNINSIKSAVSNKSFNNADRNSPATLALSYQEISQFDTICVELVPEKKGLFLKYSEYCVTSRRFNSRVTRRYNDFVALHELLLSRFPYRIIPRLPPKKIVSDANFLESRRRRLHRWLTLISRHPTIYMDPALSFFLVEQGPDVQYRIRDMFRRTPDEFMTSDFAAVAKDMAPADNAYFATNREYVKTLVLVVGRIKQLVDAEAERTQASCRDNDDLANQLKILGGVSNSNAKSTWNSMQTGFTHISGRLSELSTKVTRQINIEQISVSERLGLLMDMLTGHKDLCERLEKGLAQDHQTALAKMLSLKKRKIQGVIKGIDAESVEQLESKMLSQESVITNMEMRSDFSLYCVHMETLLVHIYLETLSTIISSLVSLKARTHSEVSNIWEEIVPIVEKFLTPKSKYQSNSTSNGK